MNKIHFVHQGAVSPSELSPEAPLVYQSVNSLPDNSKDITRQIRNSVSIPPPISAKLEKIHGKFLLSMTKEGLKHAHIFSSLAKTTDAIDRICYIQFLPEKNILQVMEYGSRRGAKYSALYPLLAQELRAQNVPEENSIFSLPEAQIDMLVSTINGLISRRKNGELRLIASKETDSIIFDNHSQRQYFYKAYWEPIGEGHKRTISAEKTEEIPPAKIKTSLPHTSLDTLAQCIYEMGEYCVHCTRSQELKTSLAQIDQLKKRLELLEDLCQSQLSALNKLKELKG